VSIKRLQDGKPRLAASKAPKLPTVFADNVLSINASFQLARRKISHSRFVIAAANQRRRASYIAITYLELNLIPLWCNCDGQLIT
jgi:hypothetical protein